MTSNKPCTHSTDTLLVNTDVKLNRSGVIGNLRAHEDRTSFFFFLKPGPSVTIIPSHGASSSKSKRFLDLHVLINSKIFILTAP